MANFLSAANGFYDPSGNFVPFSGGGNIFAGAKPLSMGTSDFFGRDIPEVKATGLLEDAVTAANWLGSKTPLAKVAEAVTGITPGSIGGNELSIWDKISQYFIKAVVIILGFIFVAVGLSLFRIPGIVVPENSVAGKLAGK